MTDTVRDVQTLQEDVTADRSRKVTRVQCKRISDMTS